jgi:2-haloacid dehalogenase
VRLRGNAQPAHDRRFTIRIYPGGQMPPPTASLPKVLLFDVNETLLDLAPLQESIDAVLLEHNASKLWFSTMLQYSLVMTVSNRFQSLTEIGAAALQMMAKNRDVVLSDDDARQALRPMLSLPAHPDVKEALVMLRAAGFRMATLTNSSSAGSSTQLAHAGIAELFDAQLSVEQLGKYKPHAEVYRWAAQQMDVEANQCMLIAAHAWDVAGAGWAGMHTAFIARAGNQLFPLAAEVDYVAADLLQFAHMLCGR